MAYRRPSTSYVTGRDELDPKEVDGALSFTRYAKAKLGCEVPVGGKARGVWFQQLKDEMEIQGWTWDDLLLTVEYVSRKGVRIRKIAGIFYFVHEAKSRASKREVDNLHMKVAEALATERNETWRKRLSLAKGKALESVYMQWREANEVRG